MFRCISHRHSGVSLMEILISIGVTSIGLLGVVSLIPVAQHKAARGTLEDRKTNVANRAFRDFKIRQFDRTGDGRSIVDPGSPHPPAKWLYPNNPTLIFQPPTAQAIQLGVAGKLIPQSYCIDPLAVSSTYSGQVPKAYEGFPSTPGGLGSSSMIQMPRLTFRSLAAAYNPIPISRIEAERLCVNTDDLVFEEPSDDQLPPFQRYLEKSVGVPMKRYADGHFTWFATVVPEPSTQFGNDRYTLSIVVCHKRPVDAATGAPDVLAERTTVIPGIVGGDDASSFLAGGVNGGDVRLMFENKIDGGYDKRPYQNIRKGEWLLLGRQVTVLQPPAGTPYTFNYFKWYRVASADRPNVDEPNELLGPEPPDENHDTIRELVLAGADWPARTPTQVTHLPGVVAVYEKTIRVRP